MSISGTAKFGIGAGLLLAAGGVLGYEGIKHHEDDRKKKNADQLSADGITLSSYQDQLGQKEQQYQADAQAGNTTAEANDQASIQSTQNQIDTLEKQDVPLQNGPGPDTLGTYGLGLGLAGVAGVTALGLGAHHFSKKA